MENNNQGTTQQHTVVLVSKPKSVTVAILLTLFFGPLGLLYASVVGGIVMIILALIIGVITLGFGLIFVWIGSIIWAVVAANNANKKMPGGIR